MKNIYEAPKMQVMAIDAKDVITVSGGPFYGEDDNLGNESKSMNI